MRRILLVLAVALVMAAMATPSAAAASKPDFCYDSPTTFVTCHETMQECRAAQGLDPTAVSQCRPRVT